VSDVRAIGTFVLADEHVFDPPRMTHEAMVSSGLDPAAFFVLQHGQTRALTADVAVAAAAAAGSGSV
jgi:hypothetical protein